MEGYMGKHGGQRKLYQTQHLCSWEMLKKSLENERYTLRLKVEGQRKGRLGKAYFPVYHVQSFDLRTSI